jgi:putative transposase
MKTMYPENWPQFFTATITEWKPLLADDRLKEILISSMRHRVKKKELRIYAFVIMSNHFHIIWQAEAGHELKAIEKSFKKFTAGAFTKELRKTGGLKSYEVNEADRQHHFWKRNSLGIELFTPAVFEQKLQYIHQNPVRAGLCTLPEDYKYSSAMFYKDGKDAFDMLLH